MNHPPIVRPGPTPTVDHLRRSGVLRQRPRLAAAVDLLPELPAVADLLPILAWHRFLFEVFEPGTLRRADAAMDDVCQAFNRRLPRVRLLYECEANPFVRGGRVDLGNGDQLTPASPLIYTVPATAKGDARTLCTVALSQDLIAVHNRAAEVWAGGAAPVEVSAT